MRTAVWNYLAIRDYQENVDCLLREWSEKEALAFINAVESLIDSLEQGNVEFKESGYQNIRQCVVRKQITLNYKLIGTDQIELLRFWNNYQDNKKLKL